MGSNSGWIGFDLDGTLAEYHGFKGPDHIGEPIYPMIEILRGFLSQGKKVKIFTARVWYPRAPGGNLLETGRRLEEAEAARRAIEAWCLEHIGQVLEVTCVKDYSMWALYDDRAIQVQKNTGRILGRPSFVIDEATDQ
jgi:hypothetical protein